MIASALDLRALLQFDPSGGVIRFANDRVLLLDAVAMGLLRKQLIDTLGVTAARAVLTRFGYAPTRPAPGLAVAYQAACSLQHGQQLTGVPKALLLKAGFAVKEPREAHLCCGSAGTYNVLQPEIAGRLRDRKLENIGRTGADLIATGNIGCITQLTGGGLPIAHSVELLDWMAGGPEPAAVTGLAARRAA